MIGRALSPVHPRESEDPVRQTPSLLFWIPAYAGMSGVGGNA